MHKALGLLSSSVLLGFGLAVACGGSSEGGGSGGGGTGASAGAGGSSTGGTGGASGGAAGTGGGTGGASGGAAGTGGGTGGGDASADAGEASDASQEGGLSDASADAGDAGPTCTIGSATSSATANDLSLFGTPVYFDNGASLPPGKYVVTYVDGCMKYGSGQGWTVNAYPQGGCCHWWMIGETTADKKFALPGNIGYVVGNGGHAQFQDCVNASKASAPVTFDHPGGKLGIWLQDTPYSDNTPGENGNNPKWTLTRLGECVDGGASDAGGGG